MTNSVTMEQEGNAGDHGYVIAKVDITSLDSAGTEPYDPATKHSLSEAWGVVLEQEDYTKRISYDNDNSQFRVKDRGPEVNQKSTDPGSKTYSANTETVLDTYDVGDGGALVPLNFDPANPSDADLDVILRATYHDGTTTDLITEAGGSAKTFENLVDGFATGDDGKEARKLEVIVKETGGADATEDIGATTTEFLAIDSDTANNTDVGTVTVKFEGDWSA